MSGTTPPIIYSFGDSLSDAGDAWLATNSQYAQAFGTDPIPVSPPYFREAYVNSGGTVDANVFSNGPVWAQDLAVTLGIEAGGPGQLGGHSDTIQAALEANGVSSTEAGAIVLGLEISQNKEGQDNPYLKLVDGGGNGADFAIGGAVTGITDFNSNPAIALSDLAAQVTNFENEITAPVANALYTVWAGANDVINLLDAAVSSDAAATDLAQSASAEVASVLQLIADGAQNVLVMNAPDIGKTPEVLAMGTADSATGSAFALEFDVDLQNDLAAADFGTASVKLGDTFSLIDNAVANPSAFPPLSNVTDPVYSGTFTTFTPGDLVSSDPSTQNTYLFFDGLHPTSTGQTYIASLADDALLACYAAGTRILTPAGEVAVEALREGQLVVTASGGFVPVRWLGHRHVDFVRHERPQDAYPVRVRADAFGPNLPHRDLLLSPDHAVFVDGVLIPVRYLINDATIAQEPMDAVTYWHVELPEHGVLLAEGMPAESYLDTGNRGAFANGRRLEVALQVA